MIHVGDCLSILPTLAANSVDAIVTDPPYGIGFMGKAWDGADITARHGYRRSMPSADPSATENGAHNSAAAAAGTYDMSPAAMRAFQQFSVAWATEALRVLKPGGYLLSFAAPRTYHRMASGIEDAGFEVRDQLMWIFGSGFPKSHNGPWGGTALKPAHEPVLMARKPLIGTVAANHAVYGTGALNTDDCGIGAKFSEGGRWPANLIHDGSDQVLAAFPNAKGQQGRALDDGEASGNAVYGALRNVTSNPAPRVESDTSAARFFYCAKASRADRNDGLYVGHTAAVHAEATMRDCQSADWAARNGNHHPTVKPTDLMRYLCRLVTPAGGTVLDPFMGSGSTGKAAALEGFAFVGIEMEPAYAAIAEARIAAAVEAAAREAALPKQIGLPLGDVA